MKRAIGNLVMNLPFEKETIRLLKDYFERILSDAIKQALCVEYAGL
jgi:hypothetical protein